MPIGSKANKSISPKTPRVLKQHFENKVYLTDAREMLELPDNSVALVVTSPPYFNIKDYALDGRQKNIHSKSHAKQIGDLDDFNEFISELLIIWKECSRVLKPNGKLIINVPLMPMLKSDFSTHENRHIFDLNASIQNSILSNIHNVHLLDTYIWNRSNPSKKLMFGSYPYPTNFYAQNTIEFVTVYVKEGKGIQPSKEIKELSKLTQEEWVNFTKQIWNLPIPGKGDLAFGTHSALMPESMAERCIRLYSFYDDLVLDPFAGSGTTLRVAKQLGRRYVGYEIMNSYKDIINLKLQENACVSVNRKKKSTLEQKQPHGLVDESILDKVFVSDYSKLVAKLQDNSIDLVCVDPPYNLRKADWDTFDSDQDFLKFTFKWIDSIAPKIKSGGGFYMFNTPRNCALILPYVESKGFSFQNWITWNKKDGFTSTKKRFLPEQESIIYLTKSGGEITFNADSVRLPYESTSRIKAASKTGILKNGKRWFPNENGRLCPDVWVFPSDRHSKKVDGKVQNSDHPTIKPLALMERIVLASSNKGDVVLDFFCGSGTTLVAAKKHSRRYIGCDLDSEYVKIARRRLKALN